MAGQHSTLHRGLVAAATTDNPEFEGRFGKLFPNLPAATFGATDSEEDQALANLAGFMVSDFDPPKDGPDPEESGIPALYTYLGQFIDHDLTFGPEGSFQKQRDPDAVVDFRSPAFDLDNIYGRGPNDQPYMYADDRKSFLLGSPLTLGNPKARDLERNAAGRALIGDPRNDENVIVSQFQGLFHRFHNRVVAENSGLAFEQVQAIVRAHYQHVVANDFLPRIVNKGVLDGLRTNGRYDAAKLTVYPVTDQPFMPVEFAVAAYRLGHSMVRPGYRLNDATLLPIFPVPAEPGKIGFPEGLTGFRRMTQDWGIDWGRFIDIDVRDYGVDPDNLDPHPDKDLVPKFQNFRRLQLAYRIDTALVDPLGTLPLNVAGNLPLSLALRNLKRSRDFGLPSGQAVADALNVTALTDAQITIGQAVDGASLPSIVAKAGQVFAGNCPLWTYILAEATAFTQSPTPKLPVTGTVSVNTPQLGPVGGRIVAEVFLGLLFSDPFSILGATPPSVPAIAPDYRLKDFVLYALGT